MAGSLYRVFVPGAQIKEFLRVTPGIFEVIAVEELEGGFRQDLEDLCAQNDNMSRSGWYLQQFNKLQSVFESESDVTVIWDSDCVPVADVPLFDANGSVTYMRGKEFHAPYFDLIHRTLGLNRVVDFSFVVPPFPIRREWARSLQVELETHHGTPWHRVLLNAINFSLRSGFSETEFLGTWISSRYATSISSQSLSWERLGSTRFGPVRDFSVVDLEMMGRLAKLDIISFETWDRAKSAKWLLRRIQDLVTFGPDRRLLH